MRSVEKRFSKWKIIFNLFFLPPAAAYILFVMLHGPENAYLYPRGIAGIIYSVREYPRFLSMLRCKEIAISMDSEGISLFPEIGRRKILWNNIKTFRLFDIGKYSILKNNYCSIKVYDNNEYTIIVKSTYFSGEDWHDIRKYIEYNMSDKINNLS